MCNRSHKEGISSTRSQHNLISFYSNDTYLFLNRLLRLETFTSISWVMYDYCFAFFYFFSTINVHSTLAHLICLRIKIKWLKCREEEWNWKTKKHMWFATAKCKIEFHVVQCHREYGTNNSQSSANGIRDR